MGRKIVTRIEFEFDEKLISDGEMVFGKMTDEEMLDYAAECFVDDIYNMVKYNELYEVARGRTEFVISEEDAAAAVPGNDNV